MSDPSHPQASTALPNLAPSGATVPPTVPPTAAGLPFTDTQVEEFREQDRWLPIANVARIMKNSLPTTAKVSKDAKECVQECVSEYISFITSEAAEKCLNEKRKTINGEDILTSMKALGFDNYEGVLKVYLAKYREHQLAQAQKRQPAQLHAQTSDDAATATVAVDASKREAEDDDGEIETRAGSGAGRKKRGRISASAK